MKYTVWGTLYYTIEVEASSEEEATELASNIPYKQWSKEGFEVCDEMTEILHSFSGEKS